MIALHVNKIKSVQDLFNSKIEKQRNSALTKLNSIDRALFNVNENNYLDEVINLFSEPHFLTSEPTKIESIVNAMGVIPPNSRLGVNNEPLKPLKKFILDALNYKKHRDSFYPAYFQKIGIKACVYCNSQLTVTIKKNNGSYAAKFDVDHFYPKDDYPFLSISLFNLYPSCTSCNRIKKENLVDFTLYDNDPKILKKSLYSFELTKTSKAKYLLTKDPNDLEIIFNAPSPKPTFKATKDLFHIEKIYSTQLDIIEELVIKSQIYTDSYKKALRESFSKLNLNSKLFERVLIGNYIEDTELHKRPMAKFTQDIAKQLGLI